MKLILKKSFLLSLLVLGLVSCTKEDIPVGSQASKSQSALNQLASESTPAFQTSENHIALEGQDNMRDLGGYVSSNGKRVLYRNLYRSGDLSELRPEDVPIVSSLGILNIIDLRTDIERNEKPDNLPAGAVAYDFPLFADNFGGLASQLELFNQIMSGAVSAEDYNLPLYALDAKKITGFKAVFELLQSSGPTLWHCTDGKDGAGMVTALVLSALDVPRATIIQDFMKSNDYLADDINGFVSHTNNIYGSGKGDKLLPLLSVEQKYIETFFNNIEAKYGSVDNFLINELNVDKTKMKKLYLEK